MRKRIIPYGRAMATPAFVQRVVGELRYEALREHIRSQRLRRHARRLRRAQTPADLTRDVLFIVSVSYNLVHGDEDTRINIQLFSTRHTEEDMAVAWARIPELPGCDRVSPLYFYVHGQPADMTGLAWEGDELPPPYGDNKYVSREWVDQQTACSVNELAKLSISNSPGLMVGVDAEYRRPYQDEP